MEIRRGTALKDRYRLDRLLGRGGMASVWRGHDSVLDRPVAVKVLSDSIAADPEFQARFRREATVAAGLSHPNLVRVYDCAASGERPYLVMELVPGEDLGARISRGEAVDRSRLARQLLAALAHIHRAGIVHRDVKPQNLLIEADGNAKLIDFGIALPCDATALTSTGLILATRSYAAPEVIRGEPASERSDLYSCGLLLQACPGASTAALDAVVERLSAEEREARPPSAVAALRQLEAAEEREAGAGRLEATEAFAPVASAATEPFAVEPEGGSGSEPTQGFSPHGRTRRRLAVAVGLLAAVAAAVVVVLSALGGGADDGGPQVARERGANASGNRGGEAAAGTNQQAQAESGEPKGGEAGAAAEPEAGPTTVNATPSGSDAAAAGALNEQGYELIQAGRYEEAVPVLEESVQAFPPGTEDVDYAYALFNLGDALLRSGRAAAAIPVLERRLRIPNQTDVVERELAAARAASAGAVE